MNLAKEDFYAKVENGKLIIELPLEIMVQSQRLRDDVTYNILDKDEMGVYFADNIIWHTDNLGDAEVGASILTNLIDELFDYAYECGETWLENPDYDAEE